MYIYIHTHASTFVYMRHGQFTRWYRICFGWRRCCKMALNPNARILRSRTPLELFPGCVLRHLSPASCNDAFQVTRARRKNTVWRPTVASEGAPSARAAPTITPTRSILISPIRFVVRDVMLSIVVCICFIGLCAIARRNKDAARLPWDSSPRPPAY